MTDLPNMGLVLGLVKREVAQKKSKKFINVIWSGGTWFSETETWNLFIGSITEDVFNIDIEDTWLFTPIDWNEEEIFCLSKAFQADEDLYGYVIIFHQFDEILTSFMLENEETITKTYSKLFNHAVKGKLNNEQLKQLRIVSQEFYIKLTEYPWQNNKIKRKNSEDSNS